MYEVVQADKLIWWWCGLQEVVKAYGIKTSNNLVTLLNNVSKSVYTNSFVYLWSEFVAETDRISFFTNNCENSITHGNLLKDEYRELENSTQNSHQMAWIIFSKQIPLED
jgi:hypothetical protein